jgi:hypothetical protein
MTAETAMPTYHMRAKMKRGHIKLAKGSVKVDVKTNLRGEEADVTVTVTPLPRKRKAKRWPKGFVERFAGCLAANPIERPAQGEIEQRLPL